MNNSNNGGSNRGYNERRAWEDRRKKNVPVNNDRRLVKNDRRNN